MKRVSEFIKISNYPLWTSQFIFKSLFIFVSVLSLLFFGYEFFIQDINFKYYTVSEKEIIENSMDEFDIKLLAEYDQLIASKAQVLSDRLNIEVHHFLTFSSTLYVKKTTHSSTRGYNVHFTDNIPSFVNLNYLQNIEIRYFNENRNGLVISKALYDQIVDDTSISDPQLFVVSNPYDAENTEVKIVGQFETNVYKSILFDDMKDNAADLTETIFAPVDLMIILNNDLNILNDAYPRNIYELERVIEDNDIKIINHILSSPAYKLSFTNTINYTLEPLLGLIRNTIVFFSLTVVSIITLILLLRFKDLKRIISIQIIFYKTKFEILKTLFFSGLYIGLKAIGIVFLITSLLTLLTYILTGYFINLIMLFTMYITVLIFLNLCLLIYYHKFLNIEI